MKEETMPEEEKDQIPESLESVADNAIAPIKRQNWYQRLKNRDRALILTGAWVLVMWLSLFLRIFPVILLGLVLLLIPLVFVFWGKQPWKRYQRVAVIIELILVAPIVVLLIMTAILSLR